ncbi:MAG: methionyl-tRNA formyltransferase, partial [Desulfocapsaceae bacterium]|nr:methionyl-tRNA formyltransferase [Desulfocapsaceae bacterium]
NILLPAAIPVGENETAGSLFGRLAELGGATLIQALDLLRQNKLPPIQQDHSLATAAPPLTKEDGCLDWNQSAAELHCLIRGLDPWPGAYSFIDGQRFRFFAPEVIHRPCQQPAGTLILADHQGLLIATAQDCLLIKEIQPEGKKRMTVEAYLCGHPLKAGTQLTRE